MRGLVVLLLGLALGAAVVALTVLTFGAGTAGCCSSCTYSGALGGAAIFYGDIHRIMTMKEERANTNGNT